MTYDTIETITEAEIDNLESMIDKHGLDTVVLALSHVCSEKAEHIRVNWQDENLALGWDMSASCLERYKV